MNEILTYSLSIAILGAILFGMFDLGQAEGEISDMILILPVSGSIPKRLCILVSDHPSVSKYISKFLVICSAIIGAGAAMLIILPPFQAASEPLGQSAALLAGIFTGLPAARFLTKSTTDLVHWLAAIKRNVNRKRSQKYLVEYSGFPMKEAEFGFATAELIFFISIVLGLYFDLSDTIVYEVPPEALLWILLGSIVSGLIIYLTTIYIERIGYTKNEQINIIDEEESEESEEKVERQ